MGRGLAKTAAAAAMLLYAHNDFVHPRPLVDALARGACAVEADVHLRGGKLLVAHRWYEVDARRTLEGLYLRPLRKLAPVKGCAPFVLNLDVKTGAAATFRAIEEQVAPIPGVRITISGNRAKALIEKDARFFVDGDFSDAGKDPRRYPLVSEGWHWWSRESAFQDAIARAHAAGQKARVYGTGDDFALQRALGADYLNADDLAGGAAASLEPRASTTPPSRSPRGSWP